jgi:poly(glycerol-phosphate) alpha-glucosyltransferase
MTASSRTDPAPIALATRRQIVATWGIPDRYGGMTASLLHRARSLVTLAGATVDIVTFETRPDVASIRARLTEWGELADGVRLLNIYEDFRHARRRPMAVPVPPELDSPPGAAVTTCGEGSLALWTDENGTIVRAEHRRADGTLALLDERERGDEPRRLLTAFDRHRRTTGQWRSARRMYFAWLDAVVGGDTATLVVDSKTAARALQHYRRGSVTTIHRVHGSHLAGSGSGELSSVRRDVFEHLDRWDAVALLTERQRADVVKMLGDPGNLFVVPNAISGPESITPLPPDPLHGVIACRLDRAKRVDQSLRVIAAVRAKGIPVTVDIAGEGSQRAALEAEARRLGLDGAVRFLGYTPNADRLLRGAAWTLLTSRSEGTPLAILQAMAAGCIPISYDVPYGPADVIEHGRTGWLAPEGDVAKAARLLALQCRLDDGSQAAMRRAAREAALRNTDREVVARWAEIERAAVARHRERGILSADSPDPRPLTARVAARAKRLLTGSVLVPLRRSAL